MPTARVAVWALWSLIDPSSFRAALMSYSTAKRTSADWTYIYIYTYIHTYIHTYIYNDLYIHTYICDACSETIVLKRASVFLSAVACVKCIIRVRVHNPIIVWPNYASHVLRKATTNLNSVQLLNILCSLWFFGKCFSTKDRNWYLTLVLTLLLNGGLYQIIFRFRFAFLFPVVQLSNDRV